MTNPKDDILVWPHTHGCDPWDAFLKSYKTVVGIIDKDLRREVGISLSEYEIIIKVVNAGGRIRLSDLSRQTLLSQSRISRKVDSLEQRGFLAREVAETRPRSSFAVTTETGEAVFHKTLQPFLRTYYRNFLNRIAPDDVPSLVRILGGLIEEKRAARPVGRPRRNLVHAHELLARADG